MRKSIFVALATAALFLKPVLAIDLPAAPAGFAWQEIPELKAAVLKPAGWFFKKEESKGTTAYFITKEEIRQGGEFSTGLTVNVFHLKSDQAAAKGKALIENMAAQHHAKAWTHPAGPFEESGVQLKDTDATGTTELSALTIANPKTNTLYLFIFESPEADWEKAWATGKQIMDTLAVDDGV